MRSTGITRPLDDLGRLVLPSSIRKMLGIMPKKLVVVYTEEEYIIVSLDSTKIGTERLVDDLGRIVIPVEIRRNYGLGDKSRLEVFIEDNTLYLRPFSSGCIFCGEFVNTLHYAGKHICPDCIRGIKELKAE